VGFLIWVLNVALFFLSILLILLVLIQRGKGGGLAGALGGIGGSSPFGSRAGDTFTRITIYVAILWFFLIMLQVRFVQAEWLTRGQEGTVAGAGTRGE
jgi:preprotein translocase subunit SecG